MARHRAFPRTEWTILLCLAVGLAAVAALVALTTGGGSPPTTTALP